MTNTQNMMIIDLRRNDWILIKDEKKNEYKTRIELENKRIEY